MAIRLCDLPPNDRPQHRLAAYGCCTLLNHEALSRLLGASGPRALAFGLGHRLLQITDGSLRQLAKTSSAVLATVRGMSPERVARLHCHFELARRWTTESDESHPHIRNPGHIAAIFGPRLRDLDVEEFHIGVLDVQRRLTRRVRVTRGVLDSTPVHAREIFKAAIDACAAKIILVHNHPGGDPTPSPFDLELTEDLTEAGELLGIPVDDHVVIGRDRYFSFKEQKCL